jgi:hypothetical protein
MLFADCAYSATAGGYENVGATYVTADRVGSYKFLEKIAEYHYLYPKKPIDGQKFPPDLSDLVPNASVLDCSNSEFRCLTLGGQAMAVPRKRLAPDDKFVVAGNGLTVVACLRGYQRVCQVALIKAECYYSPIVKGCAPNKVQGAPNTSSWLLYFIYNEDFGVTSFGIAPSGGAGSVADALAGAKQYNLVGDDGLLKP